MKPLAEETVIDYPAKEVVSTIARPSGAKRAPNWVTNAGILWEHRRFLFRVAVISLLFSALIAFMLPKRYKSSARIMPPSNSSISTAMLAALAGRAFGGLGGIGSLASSFLGTNNTSALFVDMLRSGTVSGHIIDRFDLEHVYHQRYRVDTAKYLAHHTDIVDDKKTGVITITVDDTDPRRARDIAQAYLDELNRLVNHTSISSAHQERVFIEKRLAKVKAGLEDAQQKLSAFSSTHATVDIKEQTRAMVEAAARLQTQMIVEQSSLNSLRQIYGDGNVRVRAAQARIAVLQAQLSKMSGSSAPLADTPVQDNDRATERDENSLYPPLRQLPRLAVPYSDLYREVRIQETVFELLTQQYELARIEEAKDIPAVGVIDSPGIPEKKSSPSRRLVIVVLTLFLTGIACAGVLVSNSWAELSPDDPRKLLAEQVVNSVPLSLRRRRSKQEATQ